MNELIKRTRIKMLIWLFLPISLVVILSSQLIASSMAINIPGPESANSDSINSEVPAVPDYNWEGDGLVTLWFDDGWESQYTEALPLLEEYHFKAALAVPTQIIGRFGYMDWLQVKRLQYKGWEITAHSRTHDCNMINAPAPKVNFEVVGASQDLQTENLRRNVYVTPCGVTNPLINQTVSQNYLALRGSNSGFNNLPVTDKYNLTVQAVTNTTTKNDVMGWLNEAKINHKWLILLFHRLDDSTDLYNINQKIFEDSIEAVGESELPVVLPSQVLKIKSEVKVPSSSTTDATNSGILDDLPK